MDPDVEAVALDTITIVLYGLAGLAIGAVVSIVLSAIVRLIIRRNPSWEVVPRHLRLAHRIFLMLLGTGLGVAYATRPTAYNAAPEWRPVFMQVFVIAVIFAGAFVLARGIRAVQDLLTGRAQGDEETPHFRRIKTQMQVVSRVLIAVVWLCALAGALLTFEQFRAVGASLLASAGVLSIVAGLAAQSSLANVFAGMQIAFSDALRVGDLVVVEGEMGSIEEITLTYVVVQTWDDRRWIVPSNYFTTKKFENWTRREAKLLGTVELDLDWLVPVEAVRVELTRIVRASDLWDGRSANLQVTEATGGTVRLRAVVSAATSGQLWDLRCYVREELIAWIQEHAVYALPRTRLEPETTTAPPFEEREEFVAQVLSDWEEEKSDDNTALLPVPEDVFRPRPATADAREARSWIKAIRDQRAAMHPDHSPTPTESAEPAAEVTDPGSSKSPEARLYSGSPEAVERDRKMQGPGPADMAEREQTAIRRLQNKPTESDD
ncbi:mechanosensitive ion channel family protein [Tessaracoccus flavus]|uniref:Uncharacterized protein n=1 Tax=Tessaracoccus flavus TaxID=1610493 RepID=A0A1Q2CFX2_9ACTN|nr:mechanosensitive ion channel domain-containing protein [Tessaracoccus flavus]AQP45022.1 hypothetical protein RPIT_09675 [Tessaracoccus flavus]SDY58956.1 Small-conductance mechanosensitive channel [Tessaracoccus flavus]